MTDPPQGTGTFALEPRATRDPRTPLPAWKRRIVVLACVGCALFLVFHFVAIFLFVAPPNPISAMTAPIVNGYLNPYFRQNWELFAPDPIDSNTHVLVRAKIRNAGGQESQTGWLDISAPELAKVRGTALPGRITRLVGGGRQLIADANVKPPGESADNDAEGEDGAAQRPPDPLLQAQAVRHMSTILTLAARARWGDGVTAVQMRISSRLYPRFADPHDGDDDTSETDFGWWEASPVTAEAVRLWKEAHE
ncbi:DUF5819 family protein [Nonomuraea sp. NPDC005983]|uniref:DUF5819 family protein n=1 Tax=Nonomuraea sp. NPDC005983 TaxID=3155595 RepID=UPI0033A9A0FF